MLPVVVRAFVEFDFVDRYQLELGSRLNDEGRAAQVWEIYFVSRQVRARVKGAQSVVACPKFRTAEIMIVDQLQCFGIVDAQDSHHVDGVKKALVVERR